MQYLSRPKTPLLAGSYLLGAPIGSGGMGVVHLATQPALQRQVAIKILHRELVANPGVVDHFRREALIASRVIHPNLVTILDVGELEDGTPFLVMELVPGRPLGELVREHLMPLEQSVRITIQVLAALAETHRCGVVHADVKSDNVLLHIAPDGSDWIKVIDFGLACFGRCQQATDGDGNPIVAGTPDFMAPEVIRGGIPTAAADLYGAGVLLYELLTGSTPFGGGSGAEIMMRHLVDPVTPPSLRRPDRAISPALDDAVLRALAKDPARRFHDADEMSRALHDAAHTPIAPCWCHTCGGVLAREADRCTTCGAVVPAAPDHHPFGEALDTLVSRPSPSGHIPIRTAAVVEEERRLRGDIGHAIRAGALSAMATAYRALARHLTRRGHLVAAERELREGLDLLTAGETVPVHPMEARALTAELSWVRAAQVAHDADDRPTLLEPLGA